MTRHSREDAITDGEFDELLEATDDLREPFASECELVLVAAGRLGLRAGEIAHLDESWINWRKSHIQIPRHDGCDCGYCETRARKAVECHDDLEFEEAMAQRWKPKTENSARAIPFDFEPMVEETLESYFFFADDFPRSRSAVNRRLDRVLEAAGYPTDHTYPHALRAYAAGYHAYRGLAAAPLMALFGWEDLETANKYVRASGGATAKALRETHG